jgi:Flp pilus assembly protein TadD
LKVIMPSVAELMTLAVEYHKAGELRLAEPLYRQALQLEPGNAHALHLLGLLAHQTGHNDIAITLIRQAIAANPSPAAFHSSLGAALRGVGQASEAMARFAEAIRIDPNHVDAHNNLGVLLMEQGRLDEALSAYTQAVQINPDYVDAHYNRGIALMTLGRLEQAVASYAEALRLSPDHVEAHNNLGNALEELGQLPEAIASYCRALSGRPTHVETRNNLGMALLNLGRIAEAEAALEEAIALQPDNVAARHNRALLRLLKGDFSAAWADYEYRWQQPGIAPRSFAQPRWDGEPVPGKTILVHAEQGLGDTLQFIRYAPLVKERGGRVVVECQPSLLRLLDGIEGVDQLVGRGSPLPPFAVQVPLLSLPGIFGTTPGNVPARIPYLRAESERIQHWRGRLTRAAGFRIGIAWQGSRAFKYDRYRSIPLAQFAPLAHVAGASLISLQKGAGQEQLANVPFPVHVLECLDEDGGAFLDTAAVMRNLDLVITSDSAIAHLAGGLGVPVWVALPVAPDWRWLLDRRDSPWYPTMRLFRQLRFGDWIVVFEEMGVALCSLPRLRGD